MIKRMINMLVPGNYSSCENVSEHFTLYRFPGEGEDNHMILCRVMPGIQVNFLVFHSESCAAGFPYPEHLIGVDYCSQGRVEWERRNDVFCYLGEGDAQVSTEPAFSGSFRFPTRHFHGITVTIQPEQAQAGVECLQELFQLDMNALFRRFSGANRALILRGSRKLEKTLRSIEELDNEESLPELRLKVLELLVALGQINEESKSENSPYFQRVVVEKVRTIKEELCSDLTCHKTLPMLAEEYQISETMLKRCFRAMYGNSVYAFLKDYRLQMGAQLLRTCRRPVTEVAMEVGYENPSKFTAAFRAQFGMTPMEYRRRSGTAV